MKSQWRQGFLYVTDNGRRVVIEDVESGAQVGEIGVDGAGPGCVIRVRADDGTVLAQIQAGKCYFVRYRDLTPSTNRAILGVDWKVLREVAI